VGLVVDLEEGSWVCEMFFGFCCELVTCDLRKTYERTVVSYDFLYHEKSYIVGIT